MKLYKIDLSPPARSAMMICGLLEVPVEMIEIDFKNRDFMKPEYLKKNPLHSIPVFEDGDLIIHDSHAILTYLCDKYAKNDSLYPKDLKQRTRVNQMLFFDTGYVFPRLRNVTYSALVEGDRKLTEKKKSAIIEGYDFIEEFLNRNKFLAGDKMTIADISVIANVTSLVHIVPLDDKKYPKIRAWVKELEKQPFYQKYNVPGATEIGKVIKDMVEF